VVAIFLFLIPSAYCDCKPAALDFVSMPVAKTTAAKTKSRPKPPAKAARPLKPKAVKTKSAKGGYDPLAPERVQDILNRLDQRYPNVKCALHHNSAWELLIATILSAQCTDVMVNKVTPGLFQKYPTPQAMAAATPEELEPDLRPTGFYRNKAKSVVGASKAIVENFGGQVPDDMDKLLSLPGVARKTANVVLGSWFGKGVGVVVDTHVYRISRRLELTKAEGPKNIEQDLMRVIPQAKWIDFSHQIIHHGRAICIARRPKCAECPLENICHAADKTWSTVEIHKTAQP
jgi:endonuclease-3